MGRALRTNVEGGRYHVMGRGLDRRGLFTDERDRLHFVELLGEASARYHFKVHAWVQMDTHYHLLLQTPDGNLSVGMQWFLLSYVNWFNARHQRMGPLFQGRFKAVPVEDSTWSYELSLYIHLNPLNIAALSLDKHHKAAERQGIRAPNKEQVAQRLKRLREYRWSSYRAYAGYSGTPLWLETHELLSRACREKSRRRECYRNDVKDRLTKGADAPQLENVLERIAIGSEAFLALVRNLADGGGRETTGKRALRTRVGFEDVVRAVEKLRGASAEVFMTKRGDWGRPAVIYLARRSSGLSLRELGEKTGGADYAAVGMMLKRFELRLKKDRKLRELLKRAIEMLNVETRHL